MLSSALKERLSDPDYLDLHLAAICALREVGTLQWYDAHFLKRFEAAKLFLAQVRPDALAAFEARFEHLQKPQDRPIKIVSDFFPKTVHERICDVVAQVPRETLKTNELGDFGRHILRNHEWFGELQLEVLPRVEELAGEPLEPAYNFLSLYGGEGRCDPHMDEPISMYTLDYCIDQSAPWPIHFSNMVDWPNAQNNRDWQPRELLNDPAIEFTSHELQPNQALLFTGSSRWHYRDAIQPGGFCNLLFLHYYPVGYGEVVRPKYWARHFDIPELQPLCDLYEEVPVE